MASHGSTGKKRCLSPETNRTRSSSSKRKKTHTEKKSNRKRDNKHGSARSSSRDRENRKNRKTIDTTTTSSPGAQSLSPKKKLKSISQLAKLVQLGKIAIPKSLLDYVEDSPQLLDQVFTILTPEDVKGVLPDILKGLKMKQVRQLCLAQLRLMPVDEVRRIILNEREPEPVEHVQDKAAALELTERLKGENANEAEKFADEEEDKCEAEPTDSARSSTSSSSSTSSGSSTVASEMRGTSTLLLGTQLGKPSSPETKLSRGSDGGFGERDRVHPHRLTKKGSRVRSSRREARPRKHLESDGVHTSDVSDDEGEARTNKEERKMREDVAATSDGDGEVCRVGSYDEDFIHIGMGPSEGHIDKEVVESRQSSRVEPRENRTKEDKDSDSENDEHSLESSWEQEVPEGARIMEMELRKRALEAALRHSTTSGRQLKGVRRKTECEAKAKPTEVPEQASLSTHRTDKDQPKSDSPVDPSQCSSRATELEMQLRQRALQSMLARRARAKVPCT